MKTTGYLFKGEGKAYVIVWADGIDDAIYKLSQIADEKEFRFAHTVTQEQADLINERYVL